MSFIAATAILQTLFGIILGNLIYSFLIVIHVLLILFINSEAHVAGDNDQCESGTRDKCAQGTHHSSWITRSKTTLV